MKKLILASGSPRRKELLAELGIDFDVMVSDVDEGFDESLEPLHIVQEIAKKKAYKIAKRTPLQFVLGVDTVVVLGNKIIGKAKDKEQARETLQRMRGKKIEVLSGVVLVHWYKVLENFTEKTVISVRNITDQEIDEYLNTGDWVGVAGAFNYQKHKSLLVEKITGSESNVIGLPVERIKLILQKYTIFSNTEARLRCY